MMSKTNITEIGNSTKGDRIRDFTTARLKHCQLKVSQFYCNSLPNMNMR